VFVCVLADIPSFIFFFLDEKRISFEFLCIHIQSYARVYLKVGYREIHLYRVKE